MRTAPVDTVADRRVLLNRARPVVRILVPRCTSVAPNSFYYEFHQGLVAGLQALGHQPLPLAFGNIGEAAQEEAHELHGLLANREVDAVFDLCCWSYGLSRFTVTDAVSGSSPLFRSFGVPYVAMLFDHPYFQALNAIEANQLYATFPDLGHFEQIGLLFPELKLQAAVFAPPAVRPESDRSSPSWSERQTDVLYVGNLDCMALARFWRGLPNAHLCDAIVDVALSHPTRALHLSAREALRQMGATAEEVDLAPLLRAAEYFLRMTFRYNAVTALASSGVAMQVVGRGWDQIDLPPKARPVAPIDYDRLLRLAGTARVCLDASTYLEGANDRVFTYALNRAVCITNADRYLRREFGDEGGVQFYSMTDLDALGDRVKELLGRPTQLRDLGESAHQRVLRSHTWIQRLAGITDALAR